jgi:hypothetical protein
MPGDSGVTCMLVCALPLPLHTRPRAHWAPGIPCALNSERAGNKGKTRGACAGEIVRVCLNVIARSSCDEAIHSSLAAFAAPWIASRSLSSGAHSRDPLARNDGDPQIAFTAGRPAEPPRRPPAARDVRAAAVCACARSIPRPEPRSRRGSRRCIRPDRRPG